MTGAPPFSARHVPSLDGVRGLAVLLVMVFHFTVFQQSSLVGETMLGVLDLGWAGVDIFFVLSGFLITGILLDARGGEGYFRNFYARRTLRIFPLYYAFLVVVLWIWPAVRGISFDPAGDQLWMWSYLGNIPYGLWGRQSVPGHTTHLWSLAIEEQFYLLWPLVVHLLSRRALVRTCIALIVAAWFTRVSLHAFFPSGYAGYALLPARMDALAAGALLATQVRQPGWIDRLRPTIAPLTLIGLTLLLVTAIWGDVFDPTDRAFTPMDMRVQMLAFPAVIALAAAMVLHAVIPRQRRQSRILASRWLTSLGKYSYALYLIHVPLRDLLVNTFRGGRLPPILGSTMLSQAAVTASGIAVSFVLALASWNLFEKHILRLKSRFEYQASAPLADRAVIVGATAARVSGIAESSGAAPLAAEGHPGRRARAANDGPRRSAST